MLIFQTIILPLIIISGLGFLAYWLLNAYRQNTQQAQAIEWQRLQHDKNKTTMTLRLAAYERLMILCERISIPNLVTRLRTEGATVSDLHLAMLIGIQQEFEHNVAQQIYVSEELWTILKVARDNTAQIINIAAEKLDSKADASLLIQEVFKLLGEQTTDALATAQAAIRQEAGRFL